MIIEREQEELDFLLRLTNDHMQRMGYEHILWYEFGPSLSFTYDGDYNISKPSYNIRLFYFFDLICEVAYELDMSYSMEFEQNEMHRIETMLADRLSGMLSSNGAVGFMKYLKKHKVVPFSIIKESEDKF